MIVSILTDIIHMGDSSPQIRKEQHFYTKNKTFEQSLDIYSPSSSQTSPSHDKTKPIVALVVGSAWMGHRPILYSQTSWWNSSGPKTLARLGYTCVCIRHRGSFPRVLSPLTLLFVTVMTALMKVTVDLILSYYGVSMILLLREMDVGGAAALFVAFSTGLLLMELGGYGSASFDEMQHDVMDALAWFEANRSELLIDQKQGKSKTNNSIVFGGYSSGGHVAATVMQRPEMWKERNLPDPDIYCSTILYISPVLSTRPYHVDLERHLSSLSLNKMSSTSLSSSDESSNESSRTPELTSVSSHSSYPSEGPKRQRPPPQWLTNLLVTAVFGSHTEIPSPIHTYNQTPSIPHIFIGCKNEMFGLKWLDLFFRSEDYCELLKSIGVESRYISVDSDHWNILGSCDLSDVLKQELQRIG